MPGDNWRCKPVGHRLGVVEDDLDIERVRNASTGQPRWELAVTVEAGKERDRVKVVFTVAVSLTLTALQVVTPDGCTGWSAGRLAVACCSSRPGRSAGCPFPTRVKGACETHSNVTLGELTATPVAFERVLVAGRAAVGDRSALYAVVALGRFWPATMRLASTAPCRFRWATQTAGQCRSPARRSRAAPPSPAPRSPAPVRPAARAHPRISARPLHFDRIRCRGTQRSSGRSSGRTR